VRQIPLTQGQFATVDDCDYDALCAVKWCANSTPWGFYAFRTTMKNGIVTSEYMHRRIIGAKLGEFVDHINHNGLDNRRENLRICTLSQNGANQRRQNRVKSSPYKGVSWDAANKKWTSRIWVNERKIWLGRFTDEMLAAKTYDTAAVKHFGEFAHTNFPQPTQGAQQ
jgi:hypothetical protein